MEWWLHPLVDEILPAVRHPPRAPGHVAGHLGASWSRPHPIRHTDRGNGSAATSPEATNKHHAPPLVDVQDLLYRPPPRGDLPAQLTGVRVNREVPQPSRLQILIANSFSTGQAPGRLAFGCWDGSTRGVPVSGQHGRDLAAAGIQPAQPESAPCRATGSGSTPRSRPPPTTPTSWKSVTSPHRRRSRRVGDHRALREDDPPSSARGNRSSPANGCRSVSSGRAAVVRHGLHQMRWLVFSLNRPVGQHASGVG